MQTEVACNNTFINKKNVRMEISAGKASTFCNNLINMNVDKMCKKKYFALDVNFSFECLDSCFSKNRLFSD
jgi:hypothetical protein